MGATSSMILTGGNAATGFVNQRQQAGAALAQGAYTQRLSDWNADMARLQAQDALNRGAVASARVGVQAKQVAGAQRASTAAQGIDPNSGTALTLQTDTAKFGALDELTVRNNAAREAWGYQVEAMDSSFRGEMAAMAGRNTAASMDNVSWGTLITGGANIYGMYRRRNS